MADDIKVIPSPEAGDPSVATDEVGGRHFQIVKLAIGADGAATLIDSAGLPVTVAALPLPSGASTEATLATVGNFLWRILQMLMAPLGYDKSLQRQRGTVVVETLPTLAAVTTVATVTTVAGLTNINGRNADMLINSNGNAAWALCVRARIT